MSGRVGEDIQLQKLNYGRRSRFYEADLKPLMEQEPCSRAVACNGLTQRER